MYCTIYVRVTALRTALNAPRATCKRSLWKLFLLFW